MACRLQRLVVSHNQLHCAVKRSPGLGGQPLAPEARHQAGGGERLGSGRAPGGNRRRPQDARRTSGCKEACGALGFSRRKAVRSPPQARGSAASPTQGFGCIEGGRAGPSLAQLGWKAEGQTPLASPLGLTLSSSPCRHDHRHQRHVRGAPHHQDLRPRGAERQRSHGAVPDGGPGLGGVQHSLSLVSTLSSLSPPPRGGSPPSGSVRLGLAGGGRGENPRGSEQAWGGRPNALQGGQKESPTALSPASAPCCTPTPVLEARATSPLPPLPFHRRGRLWLDSHGSLPFPGCRPPPPLGDPSLLLSMRQECASLVERTFGRGASESSRRESAHRRGHCWPLPARWPGAPWGGARQGLARLKGFPQGTGEGWNCLLRAAPSAESLGRWCPSGRCQVSAWVPRQPASQPPDSSVGAALLHCPAQPSAEWVGSEGSPAGSRGAPGSLRQPHGMKRPPRRPLL